MSDRSLRRAWLAAAALGVGLLSGCPYPAATPCRNDRDCPYGSVCDLQLRLCSSDPESRVPPLADAAADGAAPDTALPDIAVSDTALADATAPDAAPSDTAQPDTTRPDTGQPDTTRPDTAQPDTAQPDTAQPDTSLPDAGGCSTPALSFDGVNDFAQVPDSASHDGLGAITLEAWIRPSAADLVSGAAVHIISHEDPTGDDGYALLLRNGWLELLVRDDSDGYSFPHRVWAAYDEGARLLAGYWYHVAGCYNGTDLMIFRDGVLQRSEPETEPAPPVISDAAVSLRIGAAATGGGAFGGLIDEVRVSSSCRYSASFSPPLAPFAADGETVALWHLDEGAGQILADEGTNGNDGTLGLDSNEGAEDPTWQQVPCAPERTLGSTIDAGLPDASALPTCDQIYSTAAGYELCEESAGFCEIAVTTGSYAPNTCRTVCATFGGSCIAAFDNATVNCDRRAFLGDTCDTTRSTEICVCTRQ